MCLSQAKSVLGLGVDSAQNGPSQRRQTATAEPAFPVLTSGCLYQRLNDRESGCAVEPSSPSPEFPRNARLGPDLQILDAQVPAYERIIQVARGLVTGMAHHQRGATRMASARWTPSASMVRCWCPRLTSALNKATASIRKARSLVRAWWGLDVGKARTVNRFSDVHSAPLALWPGRLGGLSHCATLGWPCYVQSEQVQALR